MSARAVTTASFPTEVEQSELPVLIDFWATWCPPCRRMTPVVEALATKYAGRAQVLKCDCDTNSELAMRFGVQSIPNFLFFKHGQLAGQITGAVSEAELAAKLDELITG